MNKVLILCVVLSFVLLPLSACAGAPSPETTTSSIADSEVSTIPSTSEVAEPDNTEHPNETEETSPGVTNSEADSEVSTTPSAPEIVAPDNTDRPDETETTSPDEPNNSEENPPMDTQKILIVNGQSLAAASHMIFTSDGAMVPLVEVLEALGAEIQWVNDCTAKIIFKGKQYSLNTGTAELIQEENQANCLIPAPGSSVHYQVVDGVFVWNHKIFFAPT